MVKCQLDYRCNISTEGVWFDSTVHLSGCLLAHAVNVQNVLQCIWAVHCA